MDKITIEQALVTGKSVRGAADLLKTSYSNLRYWIVKHDIPAAQFTGNIGGPRKPRTDGPKLCSKCREIKPLDQFYNSMGRKGGSYYCRICHNQWTVERQRRFKRECIEYKGGACIKCTYNRSISSLHFHHRDPAQKDFNLSEKKHHVMSDEIRAELDKCDLLCANCHGEIHDHQTIHETQKMEPRVGDDPTPLPIPTEGSALS